MGCLVLLPTALSLTSLLVYSRCVVLMELNVCNCFHLPHIFLTCIFVSISLQVCTLIINYCHRTTAPPGPDLAFPAVNISVPITLSPCLFSLSATFLIIIAHWIRSKPNIISCEFYQSIKCQYEMSYSTLNLKQELQWSDTLTLRRQTQFE